MSSFEAVLAAVTARGPRCDDCNGWTWDPSQARPRRTRIRICRTCARGYTRAALLKAGYLP